MSPKSHRPDSARDTDPVVPTLAGSTVLVAGGGRHMGLAVSRAAAAHGARVIIVGRDRARTEAAAELVRADAHDGVVADVADVSDERAATELLGRHAGLDHLVITISTGAAASTIPATPETAARAPFDNRFWPTYRLLHLSPRFVATKGSVTVTCGSSGRRPQVGFGVYGTLHAALEGLTRAAAIELAPLRINAVSPGGIGIGRTRQLIPHSGRARDFAAAVVALMLNPAITGAVLDVDGGEFLGHITDP
jgi:NAD(P)-dependent dehydrogenase (short-subunit alcohol dehydrogenase family)